jgi:transposase
MPRPHPRELRTAAVAAARLGAAPIGEVAKDFGISDSCLRNWVRHANVHDARRPGTVAQESVEVQELRRRLLLLERENEVLRGNSRAGGPVRNASTDPPQAPIEGEASDDRPAW